MCVVKASVSSQDDIIVLRNVHVYSVLFPKNAFKIVLHIFLLLHYQLDLLDSPGENFVMEWSSPLWRSGYGICLIIIIIIIIVIIIMSVFLEHLSMSNMLNCAEQVQIQKYKMHAYNFKTLKTVGVQILMLKHLI